MILNAQQRVDLESGCLVSEAPSLDLLTLDEALTKLAEIEPAKAELVKLRFFAGFTIPEAAAALGISLAIAERNWTFAKSWLYAEFGARGRVETVFAPGALDQNAAHGFRRSGKEPGKEATEMIR